MLQGDEGPGRPCCEVGGVMTCHNEPPEDAEKGLGLRGSRKDQGPGRVVLREMWRKGVST